MVFVVIFIIVDTISFAVFLLLSPLPSLLTVVSNDHAITSKVLFLSAFAV